MRFEILLNRFRPIIYAFFPENAIWKYKKIRESPFFVCLAQFYSPFFVIITEEKKFPCFIPQKLGKEKGKMHKRMQEIWSLYMHFHKQDRKQA